MKRGFNSVTVFLMLLTLAVMVFAVACGDGSSDEDPTDRLPDEGAVDEGECKDACSKVADCIESAEAGNFLDDCRLNCEESGYFDYEAIECIKAADCDTIFDCGYEY